MGGNMKKIFVLLTTLALLTLTACISKDAKGKLEETTTPPSTVVVPETPVAPAVPVELITNGDFSASTGWTINQSGDGDPWGGTGGKIEVAYNTGAAVVTIVKGDSTKNFEAQFYQTAPLVIGKTYTVSFEYSADVDSTLVFSLEKEGGDPCYLSGTADDKKAFLTASTTTKTYSNTFTASETNDAAKVVFLLSSAPTNAKITIDKVSLKEATTK